MENIIIILLLSDYYLTFVFKSTAYIYGVACATTGNSFGLILPDVNTQSMQLFLDDFSEHIANYE